MPCTQNEILEDGEVLVGFESIALEQNQWLRATMNSCGALALRNAAAMEMQPMHVCTDLKRCGVLECLRVQSKLEHVKQLAVK